MDHGERAIVPLNFFMIVATVLFWAVFLPMWSKLVVAFPFGLILAWFGRDKYGGMQIVMLVAPSNFLATISLAKAYRDANKSGLEIDISSLVLQFLGTIVIVPVVLLLILLAFVGVALTWEWGYSKLKELL